MYSLLIVIIYLAFISLGLPDSLIGSAWPIMHQELGVSLSDVGIVTIIISLGTVISSLLADFFTKKLGTWLVTTISVFLTSLALIGFSFSTEFWILCLLSIPYGLGAGAIDAALNNYVALYYSSKHMSWLHCFWGVGTIVSPYVMGACLSSTLGWTGGYRIIGFIQIIIALILLFSLPLWKNKQKNIEEKVANKPLSFKKLFNIKGLLLLLIAFASYCALEATCMLWASTYLVNYMHMEENQAAFFASLFFIGITVGRFLAGFISDKLGDKNLIRLGMGIISIGILFLVLSPINIILSLCGFVIIGLGCAPIYPSIIHSTPNNFGKENSQAIIGIQMASAYLGSTFIPPLFGLIAEYFNVSFLPYFLLIFLLLLLFMIELLNRKIKIRI